MGNDRRLSRPPVLEAVVDFVLDGSKAELPEIEQLAQSLMEEGWAKSSLNELKASFSQGLEGSSGPIEATSEHTVVGYRVQDPLGKRIYQLRPDRVSVSHAQSYQSWDDLVSDAIKVLDAHIRCSCATSVERLAARFINRIPPPHGGRLDINKALANPPVSPLVRGGELTDFLTRQVIKGIAGGFTSNLTVATVEPIEDEEGVALVIDIDVFKHCSLPPSYSGVTAELSAIREIKNDIFFGSLSEATLEGFK